MKVFYTERDIETLSAQGVTEIEVDNDVVITDLAQDKARDLGIKMKKVAVRSGPPAPGGLSRLAATSPSNLTPAMTRAQQSPPTPKSPVVTNPDAELVAKVKAAVVARLGTTEHSDLLDRLIPILLARLK